MATRRPHKANLLLRQSQALLRQSQVVTQRHFDDVSPVHEIEEGEIHHGPNSWQAKTLKFLHSSAVELTLDAFLLFDILVLFADMYNEAEHPDCYAVMENAVCEGGSEPTCIEHEEPDIIDLVDGLSLAVTFIFLVENMMLLVILGFWEFFGNIFHAVDFIVVATSLGLEIAFLVLREDKLATVSGMLVIARLWRFVRLGHGLTTMAVKSEEKTTQNLEERIAELEDLLKKNGVKIPVPGEKMEDSHDATYHALT